MNVTARADHIGASRDLGPPNDDAGPDASVLVPHLRWELEQVMSRVRPADLSGAEIAALLVVLAPAHCRVIGGPTSRPRLPFAGGRGQ